MNDLSKLQDEIYTLGYDIDIIDISEKFTGYVATHVHFIRKGIVVNTYGYNKDTEDVPGKLLEIHEVFLDNYYAQLV